MHTLSPEQITRMAKKAFQAERNRKRLDGWFMVKEIQSQFHQDRMDEHQPSASALMLCEAARRLPITIGEHDIFAGTQRDSFARSYALINPSFRVEEFSGYCDPTAVFNDIEPDHEFTEQRITKLRSHTESLLPLREMKEIYNSVSRWTEEAVFFVEPVTGHVIPDFHQLIHSGTKHLKEQIEARKSLCTEEEQRLYCSAMQHSLTALEILAERYRKLALETAASASSPRKETLLHIADALSCIPRKGAENLYEAMQVFMLAWQLMCLEQAPNPYAFSPGNLDRLFEPFRKSDGLSREECAALLKHLLVFFNVGDRSWAISQNIIISGRSWDGTDLTSLTSYALLDAFYDMNLPQPILSVKLHSQTPKELYASLGRFFFTPGMLTPSLFNDDSLLPILADSGISEEDASEYAIAGCQEPLIAGKDNGNTTNSWLNLAKILELAIHDGKSALSSKQIAPRRKDLGFKGGTMMDVLSSIREIFYRQVEHAAQQMVEAANALTRVLACQPVPFLSLFMGGLETARDMRDCRHQGTKYNGSGCLIHGLSVAADSFIAIDRLLASRPEDAQRLAEVLSADFTHDRSLQQFLLGAPKFGNHDPEADREAARIAQRISSIISGMRNCLGNPFRPDWSTPSTHLLYGYHVGATPDGRKSREMLGYGIDPLYGEAHSGMSARVLSTLALPFAQFRGGYASHLGIDPRTFNEPTMEEKGLSFYHRIIAPLFFSSYAQGISPFYLYVNVTTPDMLQQVLEKPEIYAPGGIYIMRIHGTFVNFLDLSPAIQQDIIKRLDLQSTAL